MRDLTLYVPSDCTVSNTKEENEYALKQMPSVLKADITPSDVLDVSRLALGRGGQDLASPNRGGQNLCGRRVYRGEFEDGVNSGCRLPGPISIVTAGCCKSCLEAFEGIRECLAKAQAARRKQKNEARDQAKLLVEEARRVQAVTPDERIAETITLLSAKEFDLDRLGALATGTNPDQASLLESGPAPVDPRGHWRSGRHSGRFT